jgi:hypothetical protein
MLAGMIKGTFIAALTLFAASQFDQHLLYGKYTAAVLAILNQMRNCFG